MEDFSNMSKTNVRIRAWLVNDDNGNTVDIAIRINRRSVCSLIEQLNFYVDFIDLLEIMNVSSFEITFYGARGDTFNRTMNTKALKSKVEKATPKQLMITNLKRFLK